ncbi:hypothetical protein EXIGLDRAFT_715992 [Exidia glandulosa HHB12029]|uniref:WIBG Mago-binding domain-containing protein n=1 Tax=Exidia glandulosa HHB12029 TaxID=1314781 RepID=A0A165QR89_EXIGL|nr:hypothetical protein EXIGLDRAFT_715992 [Exidia glandulosa HHB12029]
MSSRGPPLVPEASNAGIIVHPRTLERVIPATKRPDGSVRKEIKIRPGYTPAEDVATYRSTRMQQTARNALPKGSVVGYTPPAPADPKPAPKPTVAAASANDALTKAAAKNAKRAEKRKEKRKAEQADFIRKQFEDDEPAAASADSSKPVNDLADKLKETKVS